MYAWKRILRVTLASDKERKQYVFGDKNPELNINITGDKQMSCLQDAFTIEISNLTYNQVVDIIGGEFYKVRIEAGYESSGIIKIFEGSVIYISNSQSDVTTNTIIIICSATFTARYAQRRINLNFNSGINMWAACNAIIEAAGINPEKVNIARYITELRTNDAIYSTTAGGFIQNLVDNNESFVVNSDESQEGKVLNLWDCAKDPRRIYQLNKDNVILSGGYPKLTSQGVNFTILPTVSIACGNAIKIDNSLIQMPVSDQSEVMKNYGAYLDGNGEYIVTSQKINLSNRSDAFRITLQCRARSLFQNIIGG